MIIFSIDCVPDMSLARLKLVAEQGLSKLEAKQTR